MFSRSMNHNAGLKILLSLTASLIFLLGVTSTALAQVGPLGTSGDQPRVRPSIAEKSQEIEPIDPDSLDCSGLVTFDDVVGGGDPGTNYDGIFESGGAKFAERFVGQTLTYAGDFDILSGNPSGPLSLQVGLPGQNLNIFYYSGASSQVMTGLGHLGFPDPDAIGEGAFAVLFDFDQSEFGFDLLGGNGGSATLNFFRRDGSLIDTLVLPNITLNSYGFRRVGDIRDIAGISIYNDDGAGIGFDNLCHDVEGVPGDPPYCDAGGYYFGSAGVPVQFDGSGSFDPDGTIVSYAWDFGDGNTGAGVSPVHTYADDGGYNVVLCVTDNDGYTVCCSPAGPVVPADDLSWGSLKATYR